MIAKYELQFPTNKYSSSQSVRSLLVIQLICSLIMNNICICHLYVWFWLFFECPFYNFFKEMFLTFCFSWFLNYMYVLGRCYIWIFCNALVLLDADKEMIWRVFSNSSFHDLGWKHCRHGDLYPTREFWSQQCFRFFAEYS